MAEVERSPATGLVGNKRFTSRAVRAFTLIWTWSAPRFAGHAGLVQDRFYYRCGPAALVRRRERALAIVAKLLA